TTPAEHVHQRVDREGTVIEQYRRQAEAAEQHAPPADQVYRHTEQDGRDEVVRVEEPQLGELREVFYPLPLGIVVVGANDPADVTPHSAILGRVDVAFRV